MALVGVLMVATLVGSIFLKSYLDKQKIERARQLVDLHDDLRRMQNALAMIPDAYLDVPTKIFMVKRIIQLIDAVQEVGNESEGLNILKMDLEGQLAKILQTKDDSVKRLSQWTKIEHPDTAHEIRTLTKFLHGQILNTVKSGLIPRAHGARVVKNLKVIMYRISVDLNYTLAAAALKMNKLRPALGKLRVVKGLILKSPIKQHLKSQQDQINALIEKTEAKIIQEREANAATTSNKLASGVEKIEEEEAWESKKNIYDSE